MVTLARICKYTLLVAALAFIAAYAVLAILRMRYPFELEWMEGASLQQVIRILAGQRLYVPPSLEFVPLIYTPLYFYISAGVARITGQGFFPLRLVSFLASLGSLGVIFLFVKSETKNWYAAVLASGLFAATFSLSGSWFDIARVDSLFVFLVLTALYLLRFSNSMRSFMLAGILFAASFLTKQTVLVVLLPMTIYALAVNWQHGQIFLGITLTIIIVSTLIMDYIHSGWYRFYIIDLSRQHNILMHALGNFWRLDLIVPLPIACSFVIFYFIAQSRDDFNRWIFYLLSVAGLFGLSWIASVNDGYFKNVLFPAYAALAILFGLGVHCALMFIGSLEEGSYRRMEVLVYILGLSQLGTLLYNPIKQLPGRADLKAGYTIIDQLRQTPGDVFIPAHGYLATMAGKASSAHEVSINELRGIFGGSITAPGAMLMEDLGKALKEKKFSLVILDGNWHLKDLDDNYIEQELVYDNPDVFWPKTGYPTRPTYIYVPRP